MSTAVDPDVDLLVQVLATLPTAAPTLDELATATGWPADHLSDALEAAEVAGLVEPWEDSPDGLSVILGPLAASRAGLRLEEVKGGAGRFLFRWAAAGDPEPKARNDDRTGMILVSAILAPGMAVAEYFDMLPDPNAREPIEVVAAGERLEATLPAPGQAREKKEREGRQAAIDPTIRPAHLLGLRVQWGAAEDGSGPCIGCQNRPLALLELCVRCDRAGFDFLMPPVPRRTIKATVDRPGKELAGGVGARKPGRKASGGGKRPRAASKVAATA
jgi:hypothetical protein